jgi:hypothetical protein
MNRSSKAALRVLAAFEAFTASRAQMLAMPVAILILDVAKSSRLELVKASRPQASGIHRAE